MSVYIECTLPGNGTVIGPFESADEATLWMGLVNLDRAIHRIVTGEETK